MFMETSRVALVCWRRAANGGFPSPSPTRYSLLPIRLHARHVVVRPLAGAVAPERALLADRVGALEDPVLPGGEAGEDLRFHRLGPGEAQIGFETGEAVR